MGGFGIEDDWNLTESSSSKVRNIVLVGKTGNGKSATGNSILGRKAFKSMSSSHGVTKTSDIQRTVLPDGVILNVIDTPGLCDFSLEAKYVREEIVKCVRLAMSGIHAVVIVFSVRARLSEEERAVFECLRSFFGPKLVDYMIIVFTGGDDLEDEDRTLEDYIGRECPESIKEILESCKKRVVLFNNKAKDESMKEEQVQKLLSHVNKIAEENGGQPYIDEFFAELKLVLPERVKMLHPGQEALNHDNGSWSQELYIQIFELIKQKLERLQQDLQEERAARLEAEITLKNKMKDEKEKRKKAEKHATEKLKAEKTKREESERHFKEKLEEETAAREKVEADLEIQKQKWCNIL